MAAPKKHKLAAPATSSDAFEELYSAGLSKHGEGPTPRSRVRHAADVQESCNPEAIRCPSLCSVTVQGPDPTCMQYLEDPACPWSSLRAGRLDRPNLSRAHLAHVETGLEADKTTQDPVPVLSRASR